jgi:hypothetical protein
MKWDALPGSIRLGAGHRDGDAWWFPAEPSVHARGGFGRGLEELMGYQDRINLHGLRFVVAHMDADHAKYSDAFTALEREGLDRRDEMNPVDVVDTVAGWVAEVWATVPGLREQLEERLTLLEATASIPEEGHGRADYKREDPDG